MAKNNKLVLSAAALWYGKGFALGAAGGKPTQRKGQPRLKVMRPHWKRGIEMGAFACHAMTCSYELEVVRPPSKRREIFGGVL